jgi:hypothetical protein
MIVSVRTALLFWGHSTWPQSRPPPEEVDAELQLMDALAELEENKWPDDGEVKILIPSEEEFIGNFRPSY